MVTALVSLEPLQDAIEEYARENLSGIIDQVQALSPIAVDDEGNPITVPLDAPVAYRRAFNTQMFAVGAFPTLVIKAWGIRRTGGTDAVGHLHTGIWSAQAELQWWIQGDDAEILERSLARAGAVLVRLLSAAEEHIRAYELDSGSPDLAGIDVPGATAFTRAVSLAFGLRFKT